MDEPNGYPIKDEVRINHPCQPDELGNSQPPAKHDELGNSQPPAIVTIEGTVDGHTSVLGVDGDDGQAIMQEHTMRVLDQGAGGHSVAAMAANMGENMDPDTDGEPNEALMRLPVHMIEFHTATLPGNNEFRMVAVPENDGSENFPGVKCETVGGAPACGLGEEDTPGVCGDVQKTIGKETVATGDDDFAVDEELGSGLRKAENTPSVQGHEALAGQLSPVAQASVVPGEKEVTPDEETLKVPVDEMNERQQSKKRPSKPLKRMLVAKKELDLVTKFLEGKRDLADTLTQNDCFFLATEFWAFTHEQLDFLLKRALGENSKDSDSEASTSPTRIQILTKLEESDVIVVKAVTAQPPQQPEQAGMEKVEADHKTATDEGSKETGKVKAPVGVVTGAEASKFHLAESGETRRAAAEAKLRQWKSMLEKARDQKQKPIEEAFQVSGAISCILTPAITNFLNTVKIKSIYSFFTLKKTETGAICDLFLSWRQKCRLPLLPSLSVAKYLLGVNSRIETALSSVPPVDEDKRHCMMDPIIVMTGAARDFLMDDRKILTAFDFVHTRTKDLSLALAAWRQRKGFPPLKGSGKVAMISGWKATAKEALEIEAGAGRVLEEGDATDLVLADLPQVVEVPPPPEKKQHIAAMSSPTSTSAQASRAGKEHPDDEAFESIEEEASPSDQPSALAHTTRQRLSSRKKRLSSGCRKQSDYDLHSKQFLDETIGAEATDVLASVSIHTAYQLFQADEETLASLADEIFEAKLIDGLEGTKTLVEQWIGTLRSELNLPEEDIEQEMQRKKAKISEQKQKAPNSQPEFSTAEKSKRNPYHKTAKPEIAESMTETSKNTKLMKPETCDSLPEKSRKTKPHHKTVKLETSDSVTDPFLLLSEVTRRFLGTIGITSAGQFLATRTTNVATEFVTFRKNEGMAELKGMGSIASVSGWKANCRKYCKNMRTAYWEKIAETVPTDKFAAKGMQGLRSAKENNNQKEELSETTLGDEGVPFAASHRVFGVQGTKEFPLQFKFDLSVRNSASSLSSQQDVFLTYKGSSQRSLVKGSPFEYAFFTVGGVVSKLPILQDTLLTKSADRSVDIRATFRSFKTGCGLIDLTKLGVRPINNQDLSYIKAMLRSFVSSNPPDSDDLSEKASGESNVIVRRTSLEGFQYLLNVGCLMEAGQTVPVAFPSALDVLRSKRFVDSPSCIPHLLVEAFHVLSKNDVRLLIDYLVEVVEEIGLEELVVKPDENQEGKEILKTATKSRMRIHWLARHLLRLAVARTDEEEEKRDKLYFGVGLPSCKTEVSHAYAENVKKTISHELKNSLLGLLEFDSVCGSIARRGWCPVASEFFENLVSSITEWESNFTSSLERKLGERSEEIAEMEYENVDRDKWVFKTSPISSHGRNVVIGIEKVVGTQVKEKEATALEDEGCELAINWYKSLLVQIMSKVIHACGFLLNDTDFPYNELLGQVKAVSADEEEELPGVDCEGLHSEQLPHPGTSLPMVSYQPQSYQFFMGIVWPTLREFGWRVQVVKYPCETKFVAPQWRGDHQKQGKLAKLAKQQRDRRRGGVARRVNQMGLGNLSKLTKRLLVASKPSDSGGFDKETSVKNAADITEMFLKSKFKKGKKSFDRAKDAMELVLECFDGLAPSLCQEANGLTLGESELPRNVCSIEVFMQFLLVLPSLLTLSEIQLQDINNSLQVVQDLIAFCSDCSSELFPPSLLPPTEHYAVQDKRPTPHLIHRLIRGVKKVGSEDLAEVIWEEDKKVLSDYVVTVMEQVVACRATEEDARRKNRKIPVGYPGAMCRHCLGQDREGRYFFTTIESLTTLGTVFEKHIVKCTYVPSEVKEAMTVNKTKHHEQRKNLPNGSQQAFFLKVWDRLRTMRISGDETGAIPIAQPTFSVAVEEEPRKDDSNEDDAEGKIEFQTALEVLDYVRTAVPWKGTKEIDDALNQYYTCIDFGGRIYNTRTMPKHFSPAWLLAKVGPKQAIKKRNNLPG